MRRSLVLAALLMALILSGCSGQDQGGVKSGSGGESVVPEKSVRTSAPKPERSIGKQVSVPGGKFARVSPGELRTMLEDEDFPMVNVHIPFEGNIPGTNLSIPYNEIGRKRNLDRLPGKNEEIVLYCRSGSMSYDAASTLVKLGYRNVRDIEGGMIAWEKAGFPLKGG